jgi:AraC-like DNA-binding protein
VRLERAAHLLRSGRCNVTEAAMAVGYTSLSHFSKAFWETFGCCPGLYGNARLAAAQAGANRRKPARS